MVKPIEYSREALGMLKRMDRRAAARIVEILARDASALARNVKRMKGGGGLMRLRVGDWRVIYRDNIVIAVLRIASRGSAYD